jgi:hypothetical protein
MFNRKRSQQIEEFALQLAREFQSRCAPADLPAEGRKTAALGRAIDDTCNRAAAYQREQNLGMYGKAKLGTSFKIELKDMGYPGEFVDSLTSQLLLTMSGKQK